MMKIAFSTVACPGWTLEQVASQATAWGYPAVELRSFGEASRLFGCDPALSAPEKTRGIFGRVGVDIACIATSASFDTRMSPPVLGCVFGDGEVGVRAAKAGIDLAATLEAPFIRVFGFQIPGGEPRAKAVHRIGLRLGKVVDHADKTGVRVVVENGGSFRTAAELSELLDAVDSPLLGACYNVAVAHMAGESPAAGINVLGERLMMARVKDVLGGNAVPLGTGEVPCKDLVAELAGVSFAGPLVYEWDAAWNPAIAPAEQVLPEACKLLFAWCDTRGAKAVVGASGKSRVVLAH